MSYRLIVEGNAVYEVDTECLEKMDRVRIQEEQRTTGRRTLWRKNCGITKPRGESEKLWGIDTWLF